MAPGFFPAQADKIGKCADTHTGKNVLQIFALSLEEAKFPGGDPQQLWLCKWHKQMVEMLMPSTPP